MSGSIHHAKSTGSARQIETHITQNCNVANKHIYTVWLSSFLLNEFTDFATINANTRNSSNLYIIIVNCAKYRSYYTNAKKYFENGLGRSIDGLTVVNVYNGTIGDGLTELHTMLS